jgi:hypothetical protein
MIRTGQLPLARAFAACVAFGVLTSFAPAAAPVDFNRDIRPILSENCFHCHGPDADAREADLRLDTFEGATADFGGYRPVVPGDAAASEVYRRIVSDDEFERMPPPDSKRQLDKRQQELVRAWIASGAKYALHWAFIKPVRPDVPGGAGFQVAVRPEAGSTPGLHIRNPIDAFVLRRLRQEKLAFSRPAGPRTLIRRVSLDLIGLPPGPDEVTEFVRRYDRDADAAYEALVDRLLASDRFGERWARPWLDLARYADSNGFQADQLRDSWAYRDWVIDALNANMPFDQFTIEQLAGDLLPNATADQKIATGFHRTVTCNVEAGVHPEENRTNQVVDRVNTTGTVWLGITMECVQCHNHKYDPFTMEDYYSLFAYFNNTPLEVELPSGKNDVSHDFVGPYMELPSSVQPSDGRKPGKTLVMVEMDEPRKTRVLSRGNYLAPQQPVLPRTPTALHPLDPKLPANRLGLARWLVGKDNPLVARVTVNRWWAELFGRGIVATLEDFGTQCEPPTHPALLDWLAVEFMDTGWDMKRMLRLMVTSAAYRQDSRITAELLDKDPENKLYGRAPRFRMDAERIRDNALAVSGLLSTKMYGRPVMPYQPPGVWRQVGRNEPKWVEAKSEDRWRRGIYIVYRRAAPYPSMVNFDAPDRGACIVNRPRTNTPLQALTLLNDPAYVEMALALADRILTESPRADSHTRLGHAFQIVLARPPTDAESKFLAGLVQRRLAHYESDPASAKTLAAGASTVYSPKHEDRTELAAWFFVANILLNLDETITKG